MLKKELNDIQEALASLRKKQPRQGPKKNNIKMISLENDNDKELINSMRSSIIDPSEEKNCCYLL